MKRLVWLPTKWGLQQRPFSLRFRQCCENALQGVCILASKCSGLSPERIEQVYRQACEDGVVFTDEPPEEDENDVVVRDPVEGECLDWLEQLKHDVNLPPIDVEDDGKKIDEEAEVAPWEPDIPDKEELDKLFSKESVSDPFRLECSKSPRNAPDSDAMPTTLLQAVTEKNDLFNNLFRLAVFLRSTRGGCDVGFLKNARSCRRASKTLNWYQPPS